MTMEYKIPLRNCNGDIVDFALVDAEKYAQVSAFKWYRNNDGYVIRIKRHGNSRETIYLHRFIVGLKKGDPRIVDHINGNRLDCRMSNLRIISIKDNNQNRANQKGARSRYRGVHWDKQKRKWRAEHYLNGRRYHLGFFDSEDEAGAVAARWRKQNMPLAREV